MKQRTRYEEPLRKTSPSDEELEIFHGYEMSVHPNLLKKKQRPHPKRCRCASCISLRKATRAEKQSDHEIAPAVIAAGAAVGTLGYAIVKDLFNSGESGDVKWKLNRMDGTKFPDDDKSRYGNIRGYREKGFSVKGSFNVGYIDELSAEFEVTFSYNQYSVSNIYIENTGVNDAIGWGLVVNQGIRKVDQVFYVDNHPVSAVDIKFHFHFSSPLVDKILLINYRVYGNGYWKRTRYRWN